MPRNLKPAVTIADCVPQNGMTGHLGMFTDKQNKEAYNAIQRYQLGQSE